MRWVNRLAAVALLLVLPWLAEITAGWASPRRSALAAWLAGCQGPQGGLRNRPDTPAVIPYFANQIGLALLETPEGPLRVRAYLSWYLARLNPRDRYGLSGTIYDYQPDVVGPPGYDSADAYAATFLSLVRAYVERTGDWGWVRRNEPGLAAVGNLLLSLQDPDGLFRTGGPSAHRFLMDNAEDYRGLEDWAWLLDGLGRRAGPARQAQLQTQAAQARLRARLLAVAVGQILWDSVSTSYRWASPPWPPSAEPAAAHHPDWSRWYPDTVAQVFPAMYGLPQPPGRARQAYNRIAAGFPGWTEGRTGNGFPWLILGLAAWQQGDQAAVHSLLGYVVRAFPTGTGWSAPVWRGHEAAAELRLRAAVEAPAWSTAWRFLDGSY